MAVATILKPVSVTTGCVSDTGETTCCVSLEISPTAGLSSFLVVGVVEFSELAGVVGVTLGLTVSLVLGDSEFADCALESLSGSAVLSLSAELVSTVP